MLVSRLSVLKYAEMEIRSALTQQYCKLCLSFCLLDDEESVLSAKGVHTVAIFNGSETYENIATGFADAIEDINAVFKRGHIEVGGKKIELQFFLGGDYKFLLLVCGLSGATSNHACLHCKVHKDQRWDTSKDLAYCNKCPVTRTLVLSDYIAEC